MDDGDLGMYESRERVNVSFESNKKAASWNVWVAAWETKKQGIFIITYLISSTGACLV